MSDIPDSHTRTTEVSVTHHDPEVVRVHAVLTDPEHHLTVDMEVGMVDLLKDA